MNINFSTISNFSEIKLLVEFIRSNRLSYPGYDDWIGRITHEIDSGWKTVIIAWEDGHIVGNVIFQPHKELAGVREIKNLRTINEVASRRFGTFLIKQAEWYEANTYNEIIADYREEQKGVASLLRREKYAIVEIRPLYDSMDDIVVIKKNPFAKERNDPKRQTSNR